MFFSSYLISQNKFTRCHNVLSSDLYRSLQDNKGFIWVTCEKGVMRFDGQNMSTFTVEEGLPTNDIWNISLDEEDRIWLTSFADGLWYIQDNKVKLVPESEGYNDLEYVHTLKSTILFYSKSKRENYIFSPKNNRLTPFECRPDEAIVYVDSTLDNSISILKNERKSIFVSRINGEVTNRPPKNGKRKEVKNAKNVMVWNINDKITASFYSKNGVLDLPIKEESELRSISKINDTSYVIIYEDFLECYSNVFKKERDFKLEQALKPLEGKYSEIFVSKDREQNYWIIPSRSNLIFLSSIDLTINNLPIKQNLKFLEVIDSLVVVATNDKDVFLFNMNNYQFKHIQRFPNTIKNIFRKKEAVGVQTNRGLYLINLGGGLEFLKFQELDDKLGLKKLDMLVENNLMLSDSFKQTINAIESIRSDSPRNEISHKFLAVIKEVYFVGHIDFIECFDIEKNEPIFKLEIKDAIGIFQVDNFYFVYTNGRGIYRVDKSGNILNQFNYDFTINSIEAKKDTLVFATNAGIYVGVLNKSRDVILPLNTITSPNSLTNKDIKYLHLYQNELYLFGNDGFSVMNWKDIINKPQASPILYLDSLICEDKRVTNIKNDLVFEYDQNDFTFWFTGVIFNNEIKYLYSLERENESAIYYSTNESFVNYSSLKPGSYSFKIKAVAGNGLESQVQSVNFRINSHFTSSNWFLWIIIVLILIIILTIVKWRVNKVKRKNNLMIQYQTLKLNNLQAQMTPHFTYNVLNSIQSILFLKGEEQTNKFIGAYANLIRKNLNNEESDFINISEEIEFIESYLYIEKQRLNGNLDYHITVSSELDIELKSLPKMLIQPIVENAILHGLTPKKGVRKLDVDFQKEGENQLIISIKDNGIGIRSTTENLKESRKNSSLTYKILDKRIEIINKYLKLNISYKIRTAEKRGTEVVFIIHNYYPNKR